MPTICAHAISEKHIVPEWHSTPGPQRSQTADYQRLRRIIVEFLKK
jgi:hypothetical protein